MRISVYVPCHNNETTVAQTLQSLKSQTRPADQFLFINDRCTDRSPQIAAESGFEVHDVPAGKKGLSVGRNLALELATGDVLLGFDADAIAVLDYLQILEQQFEASPQIAAIGGRLDEQFQQTPPDLWRAIHMPQHHGPTPQVNPVFLFGSTMAIRVSAARQIGGWNERFVTNFEDVDICTRLRAAGQNLLYVPTCRAFHLRRDTIETVLRTFWNWNYHGFEHLFCDLPTWFNMRASTYWNSYVAFRFQGAALPNLSWITLLFPWSWAMRDLNALRIHGTPVGNLRQVASIAAWVLMRQKFPYELVHELESWLEALADELDGQTADRGPLHPQIMINLRESALRAIPDCSYAFACRNAMALR